jgi:hypothetical protein
MIVGNSSVFAIESAITRAYERPSLLALGFFAIHVGGSAFGVCATDATMLACSFDEARRRIDRRGTHTASFSTELDAGAIADAFRRGVYGGDQDESYFGIPRKEFSELFYRSSHLMWAPDGDEAFDDGSYLLQFDVGDRVRLIAFKCHGGTPMIQPPSGMRGSRQTSSIAFFSSGTRCSSTTGL